VKRIARDWAAGIFAIVLMFALSVSAPVMIVAACVLAVWLGGREK
jgi:hypothetical protein